MGAGVWRAETCREAARPDARREGAGFGPSWVSGLIISAFTPATTPFSVSLQMPPSSCVSESCEDSSRSHRFPETCACPTLALTTSSRGTRVPRWSSRENCEFRGQGHTAWLPTLPLSHEAVWWGLCECRRRAQRRPGRGWGGDSRTVPWTPAMPGQEWSSTVTKAWV